MGRECGVEGGGEVKPLWGHLVVSSNGIIVVIFMSSAVFIVRDKFNST